MKGFFFSISIISLAIAMLVALSLSHALKPSVSPLLLSSKVVYAWEDIAEDLSGSTGLNVSKTGTMLEIIDELPAPVDIPDAINTYVSFVHRFYNASDLSLRFYSSTGQEITDFQCFGKKQCTDNDIQFHVLPFNITYTYPDWNKRLLEVICYASAKDGFPACDFSKTRSVNISINLTSLNFTCNPAVYNDCSKDDIEWNSNFDNVFGCTSGASCINYTLTIQDNASRIYRCAGVYGADSGNTKQVNCNETTLEWQDDKEAKLSIKSAPCKVTLSFGKDGRFRAKGSVPNGNDDNNADDCNVNMSTQIIFGFSTSDFWFDLSSQMNVRDAFANYSVQTEVR